MFTLRKQKYVITVFFVNGIFLKFNIGKSIKIYMLSTNWILLKSSVFRFTKPKAFLCNFETQSLHNVSFSFFIIFYHFYSVFTIQSYEHFQESASFNIVNFLNLLHFLVFKKNKTSSNSTNATTKGSRLIIVYKSFAAV